MIKIDIDKVMEKIGKHLTIGDQRTVKLVLGAVNECLSEDSAGEQNYGFHEEIRFRGDVGTEG